MSGVQARAFAKVNLGLRILGRRHDGFHELRTVFQTISLADTVALQFRPGRGVRLEMVRAGVEVGWPDLPEGRNLAVRAVEWGREAFGIGGQIGIRLHKRIPVGAGLGGGSADAAAVLRLLAARARRRPPEMEMMRLAAALGSDVPALLLGGTVLGLGRGEECYRLPRLPPWHCVLAMPESDERPTLPLGISTAAAFRRWDELHPHAAGAQGAGEGQRPATAGRQDAAFARSGSLPKRAAETLSAGLTGAEISASINGLLGSLWRIRQMLDGSGMRASPASRNKRGRGPARAGPKVRAGIENDFAEAVFSFSPDFSAIRRALERSGAVCVGLSGSGAAQYGLFATPSEANAARVRLTPRLRSWTARFVGPTALAPRV